MTQSRRWFIGSLAALGVAGCAAPATTTTGGPNTSAAPSAAPAATPAGSSAAPAANFAGKTLNVALAPGRVEDFNKILLPAIERTGGKVNLVGLRSADQLARARIEKDKPTLDVLWVDVGDALVMGQENILAKVTEADAPNLKDIRDNAKLPSGIAPITFSSALGFLYNKEILKTPPKSWAELWSPNLKGQLALFDFGSNVGVLTLVMAAKLAGGSESNIDPGFKKMIELKPNAAGFKTSGPDNNNLVAQGEAGLTFALANQTQDLQKNGAPVDWLVPTEGAMALPQGFQLINNAPNMDFAKWFINYTLGVEAQNRFANELLLVSTNKNVVLEAKNQPLVPVSNIQVFNFDLIGQKRGEWTNRFNREVLGG